MRTVGVATVAVVMTMVCGAGEESGRKKIKKRMGQVGGRRRKKRKKKKKDGERKRKKNRRKTKTNRHLHAPSLAQLYLPALLGTTVRV